MKTIMDSGDEIVVRTEGNGNGRVIRVEGPIDLANAAALRQAMVDALAVAAAGAGSTTIDLAGVSAVDLCGLQLICSAHRTFTAQGASICLCDAPDWFRQAATAAGFRMDTLTCHYRQGEECLWRD